MREGEDGRKEETVKVKKKREITERASGREKANDFDLPLEAVA